MQRNILAAKLIESVFDIKLTDEFMGLLSDCFAVSCPYENEEVFPATFMQYCKKCPVEHWWEDEVHYSRKDIILRCIKALGAEIDEDVMSEIEFMFHHCDGLKCPPHFEPLIEEDEIIKFCENCPYKGFWEGEA
jgi:hypothetical protein